MKNVVQSLDVSFHTIDQITLTFETLHLICIWKHLKRYKFRFTPGNLLYRRIVIRNSRIYPIVILPMGWSYPSSVENFLILPWWISATGDNGCYWSLALCLRRDWDLQALPPQEKENISMKSRKCVFFSCFCLSSNFSKVWYLFEEKL